MKFIELLNNSLSEDIEASLIKNYNITEDDLEGYYIVYKKLLSMNPVVNSTRICITYVHPNDIDNKGHWSVDGMDGTLQKDTEDFKYFKDCSEEFANSEVVYALEFTKWNEWLGMDIDSETLNNVELTKADIVSHILYEMTYCGYQEEEIQEKLSTLNDRVDKIKNMTDEELKKNTVSIDELMESLKDKIEDGK